MNTPTQSITVTGDNAHQRLDRFCRKWYKKRDGLGLSQIYSWVRKGEVKVNGHKKSESYKLQPGDKLLLPIPQKDTFATPAHKKNTARPKPVSIPSIGEIKKHILFEDENRLVRNKPAGIVIHSNDQHANSIHTRMQAYLKDKKLSTQTFTPSFCYRLDKDTSGVLIAATSYQALQWLNEQIRERHVKKEYLTRVVGEHPQRLVHDQPLHKVVDKKFGRGKMVVSKEQGKESYSESFLIQKIQHPEIGTLSKVRVQIKTGRMHQIRVHLAHAGFPVLGDIVYGLPSANRKLFKKHPQQHILHCHRYSFVDHNGKEQSFVSEIKNYFG